MLTELKGRRGREHIGGGWGAEALERGSQEFSLEAHLETSIPAAGAFPASAPQEEVEPAAWVGKQNWRKLTGMGGAHGG